MAKRSKKVQKSKTGLQELVVVTYAEDHEHAKEYETLLKTNDIPAMIKEQHNHTINANGIAVMVPEDYLDEAHVIIESQNDYEDFYNLTLDDDDFDDYDNIPSDDDF